MNLKALGYGLAAFFAAYLLPRSAHDSLVQTRDQLRLLAVLTEARKEPTEYVVLSLDALSELFERTAGYVDDALSLVIQHGPEPEAG